MKRCLSSVNTSDLELTDDESSENEVILPLGQRLREDAEFRSNFDDYSDPALTRDDLIFLLENKDRDLDRTGCKVLKLKREKRWIWRQVYRIGFVYDKENRSLKRR